MALDFLLKSFAGEDPQPARKKYAQKFDMAALLQRERMRTKKRAKSIPMGKGFAPSVITYGWCERAKVGQLLGVHEMFYEKAAPKLQLTLDFGNAIHEILQGYMWDAGLLEGEWRCLKCDEKFYDISPQHCPKYKSHSKRYLEYKEIPVLDERYMIKGRCDGIIHPERYIWDIKSIAGRTKDTPDQATCFEDLQDEPKFAHKAQIMLYFRPLGIPEGDIVYVNKNTAQIKSYHVEYDETVVQPYYSMIERTINCARLIYHGENYDLPPTCDKKACTCEDLTMGYYKGLTELSRASIVAPALIK